MKQRTLVQLYKRRVCPGVPEALDVSCWHPGHLSFAAAISHAEHGKTSVSASVTATVFPPDSRQAPVCIPKRSSASESLQGLRKDLLPDETPALPLPHHYLPVAAPAAGPGLQHKAHTPRLTYRLCCRQQP